MKLLVRNLARTTTEQELQAIFEKFGDVTSCDLVLDQATGESKGFGFVEMPQYDKAKKAMLTLNGKPVNGSLIRVKLAE
ncbi:RNA-binding protein [Ferrimonas pelagia]|uniref:RNA-binding protein n=1 Tax=Ferrimonas pelagia TaxID=1177826 RepID=A0ABP9ET89_9GAMM